MKCINILIADDEPLAHKVLEGYFKKIDYIKIAGHCYDGLSTLNFLNKTKVDVVLLDIQMPDLTGLELLDSLKQNMPKVILTTAYTDYALKGFEYDQVVDYLHKPIRLTRFIKAIERVRKLLLLEQQSVTIPETTVATAAETMGSGYLHLKDNKTTYRIPYDNILYIQAWGNYLKFFLTDQDTRLFRKTIKAQEKELPSGLFLRIHKSYIVNIKKVSAIEGHTIIIQSSTIPIGKSYLVLTRKKIAE